MKQAVIEADGQELFQEIARRNGCKLTIVDCKTTDSLEMSFLAEIEGLVTPELLAELKAVRKVKRVYPATTNTKKTLVMIIMDAPTYCQISKDSNAFCLTCPYNSETSRMNWKLVVRSHTDLAKTIDMLEYHALAPSVVDVGDWNGKEEKLTSRQDEILLAVIRQGYYDFPRKKSLTALAGELTIRPSTLSEIIRRSESKIMRQYAEERERQLRFPHQDRQALNNTTFENTESLHD